MKKFKRWKIRLENWCFCNWRWALIAIQLGYLYCRDPYFWSIVGAALLVFHALWLLTTKLSQYLGLKQKIKYWHFLAGMGAILLTLCTFEQSASAWFLGGLETFTRTLVNQARVAAGSPPVNTNTNIDPISLIFTAIRGVFIFMILGSLIQAKRLGDQNQDPRPMLDVAWQTVLFIVVVDVITFFIVGTSAETT